MEQRVSSLEGRTRSAIIWSSIFNEPFASLYPILPVILLRDLKATAFQIVLLTVLKPLVSLFSFYWSARLDQRPDRLRANLIGAGVLARVPFLISIFFNNVYLMIASAAIYMLFNRAGMPAWMEILKRNMSNSSRHRFFSIGSAVGYAEGVLIAIGVGSFLDAHTHGWRYLFFASALLGIIGVLMQGMIPIEGESIPPPVETRRRRSFRALLLKPWRDSWVLLRTKPDFGRFQMGFMAGGFGLMMMQPVVPTFFDKVLHLSYTNLMIAYSICKGLGFVVTSPLWSRALERLPPFRFTSLVLLGFATYPLLLSLGQLGHIWVYTAFLLYGISQAGSHLIWHLSGPLFAGGEDSPRYSGVNVAMVGIRGVIAPTLGGICCSLFGPLPVFYMSVVLCLIGIIPLHPARNAISPQKSHK